MDQLFRKKSVSALLAEAGDQSHQLRRALGPFHLLALGIGAVIGAGIFVLTGSVAARNSGPAITLSFILAGLACVFAGLCYSELAAMIPISGSAYTYGYAALGEFVAWIIGWDLILEYAFSAAGVASGLSGNIISLAQDFGIRVPPTLIETPGQELYFFQNRWELLATIKPALDAAGIAPDTLPHATAIFNLPAFLGVCVVTAILVVGVRESAGFNTAIVFVKVATVLLFLVIAANFIFGHPKVAVTNWTPYIPENKGSFGSFGWSGIARGAATIFFAYIGFDAVSTAAQEAKNPQRDMPIGILGSLAICTILYLLVGAALTGVVHYPRLDVAAPVALAVDEAGVKWGGGLLVKGGTIAGLSTVMLTTLMGQSRIFFAMGKDGLLPRWTCAIHPRFRTPWVSTLVVGLCVAIFGGLLPISVLGQLVSIGTLFAFIIVCLGVLVLRRTQPDTPRPFRVPGVGFVTTVGAIVSLGLMLSLPLDTWIRLVVWMVIGLVIYFMYGVKHSRLGKSA